MTRKKGQYKIVYEVMLILIGIFITGYVISNFTNLQSAMTTITVKDNFNIIADQVMVGIVKVSNGESSLVRIEVPEKVSEFVYEISLTDGNLTVKSLNGPPINVTREIFNIGQVNRINQSRVVSSARTIEVVAEYGKIVLRRGI
jgi:hypothetical protein